MYDKFAKEKDEEKYPTVHLVPCRWMNTGWKRVVTDPSETKFFNSQNRVNGMGFRPEKTELRT